MDQIAFGLFDWIDRGTAPIHQLYEDRLQLLQAAETAGFFSYHLAEHQLTPLSMAPSPALFLAAATQRTRRIRLGPLVYLLPLYDPLRLIAEVCMLDQMSLGRLELGIGCGVSPYELRHYGVNPAKSRHDLQRDTGDSLGWNDPGPADLRGQAFPIPRYARWSCSPSSARTRRSGIRRTARTVSATPPGKDSILSIADQPLRSGCMLICIGGLGSSTATIRANSTAT